MANDRRGGSKGARSGPSGGSGRHGADSGSRRARPGSGGRQDAVRGGGNRAAAGAGASGAGSAARTGRKPARTRVVREEQRGGGKSWLQLQEEAQQREQMQPPEQEGNGGQDRAKVPGRLKRHPNNAGPVRQARQQREPQEPALRRKPERDHRMDPNFREKTRLPRNDAAIERHRPSGDKSFTVEQPGELLSYLLEAVAGRGRNALKSMLGRGQIEVNGRIVTAYNYALQPGHTVTVRKEAAAETMPLAGMSILHEDEDIIVIQKDAGLLSISAGPKAAENEITAYRQLTAHVRQANPKGRVFVVHRLDRDTSGVMMFAKKEAVQQQLQNDWQEVVKERSYVALVEGKVRKPEDTITSWLKETKTLLVYSSQHPNDGQYAVTHYKTLQTNGDFSLLEVQLETGRKNQIRVHLSDIGHPIVGDKKYGAKSRAIGRLGLHARVLSFVHPSNGELMRFETDIPRALLRPFQTT